jgi:hypothetical protein
MQTTTQIIIKNFLYWNLERWIKNRKKKQREKYQLLKK